jgi:hypothetical protein
VFSTLHNIMYCMYIYKYCVNTVIQYLSQGMNDQSVEKLLIFKYKSQSIIFPHLISANPK